MNERSTRQVPAGVLTRTSPDAVTFYTVANAPYFVGAACLVNSLRLTSNEGEIVVLDQGLTTAQKKTLERECTLIPEEDVMTDVAPEHRPFLVKPYPRLLAPQGIVVIIDSDMIVTGSLDELIDEARRGKIVAFPNPTHRRFIEWVDAFDLPRPPRSAQPYVNAGLVIFSAEHWPHLLDRWWECCVAVAQHPGDRLPEHLTQLDQDALNALLMTEIPKEALLERPGEESPAFGRLNEARLDDRISMRCSLHGTRALILHHAGAGKPWDRFAWSHLRRNPYVRLIPRTLFAPDVALRLNTGAVPLWLRPGPRAGAIRLILSGFNRVKNAALPLWRRIPTTRRRAIGRAVFRLLPGDLKPRGARDVAA